MNSFNGTLSSRHQVYTKVIKIIALWQSVSSVPTASRHFPQFTICSVQWRIDIYIDKTEAHMPLWYNFRIGIPMLAGWSDRCRIDRAWWRHQMETFSALLAICAGNSPVPGEFPTQRPVTRSFDVYFDLRPNKRSSKQSLGWWFETLSPPLWRHRNEIWYSSLVWTMAFCCRNDVEHSTWDRYFICT